MNSVTPALVHSLPDKVRDAVILAYQHALTPVFRYLTPLFVVGLVLAFLLPDKQLASSNTELDGSTTEPQQAGGGVQTLSQPGQSVPGANEILGMA
jgi:hypothetical protein